MRKQYIVQLTDTERAELEGLVSRGVAKARRITRARILLLADAGRTDHAITEALLVGMSTVERARRKYHEGGVEQALSDRPRPGASPKLDGAAEAVLVTLACSAAPEGRDCWTLQLLADRLVELDVVGSISDETVRRTLKKTSLSPGRSSSGAFQR